MAQDKLTWQSKMVLLLVLPAVGATLILEAHWWAVNMAPVAIWVTGLSLLLGLVALKMRSATFWGACAGAVITAGVMYATAIFPYVPWHTALLPVLAVLVLTSLSTRLGRAHKERVGLAEKRIGRSASQVAANLGVAALMSSEFAQSWLLNAGWIAPLGRPPIPVFAPMLAALCEAAADTVSSEIGQVFGGQPRMITTLRKAAPGANGAISLAGTVAGVIAASVVAVAGAYAFRAGMALAAIAAAGGVFGLLFDSLLGATLERRGWLNNDLVNFLSTASAAAFAVAVMALIQHLGIG